MRTRLEFWRMFGCMAALIGSPLAVGQRRPSVKLELNVTREHFLLGESISVEIHLKNSGTEAIDAPKLKNVQNTQPVYRLEGPSYPHGVTFSLRDVKLAGDPAALSANDTPSTYRLRPGEVMETGFKLDELKPITEPGMYTISAKINWGGWSAEAPAQKFRVDKAKFLEGSLGVDVAAESTRTLRAVWIAESPEGRVLGESFFYEKRPDLGEAKVAGTRIIRTVGPGAFNPFCPWVNFDRTASPKFWHGWQEGATLFAFSDDESAPRSFELGSKKAQIVQPAYMSKSGDLEVLVLGENRQKLRLVRFMAAEGKPPEVLWSLDLAAEAAAIRLGIGPVAEGGHLVAAYVSQTGPKVSLHLIRIEEKAPEPEPPAIINNAFLLPDSQPSVSIVADGTVHASVLLAKHPGLRTLAVADLVVSRGTAAAKGQVTLTDAGRSEAAVIKGWTAQPVTLEGPRARFWLIRTAQGVFGGGSQSKPVAAGGPVVDFLRMSGATYVLVVDPNRGPRLIPAEF